MAHGGCSPCCEALWTSSLELLLTAIAGSFEARAQGAPTPRPVIEEQRQQDRERALREQNEPAVEARLPGQPAVEVQRLPGDEVPCFRIDRVVLSGERSEDFKWALDAIASPQADDSPLGHCIGTKGVNAVLARVQRAIIARGFVTTRVLAVRRIWPVANSPSR